MRKFTINIMTSSFFLLLFNLVTPAQTMCPEGMISYWNFDESGSADVFADTFGGHSAVCTQPDCPAQAGGILNKARSFDGSMEVTVADDPVFDWGPDASFSIEAWVKTSVSVTSNKVFTGKWRGNSDMLWWLGYGDGNIARFEVRDSGNISVHLTGTSEINDNNWHHIVGVKDGEADVMQIFVDGVKENEVSTSFTGDFSGSDPLYIGFFINDYHYEGLLDEIAVYNKALSETSIKDHYEGIKAGYNYCTIPADVEDESIISKEFKLFQNYPNPFNPSTRIKFTVPQNLNSGTPVTLRVFDVLGNEVAVLVDSEMERGIYEISFDAGELPSGIYFYRLNAGTFNESRKMALVK